MTIIVCLLHLLAAEYIPAERSKGDILRFRRTNHRQKITGDSEAHSRIRFAQDINKLDDPSQKAEEKPQQSIQDIQRQLSIFHWQNLSYDVKAGSGKTKRILDDVNGWVKPGTLTALMASVQPQTHHRFSDTLSRA